MTPTIKTSIRIIVAILFLATPLNILAAKTTVSNDSYAGSHAGSNRGSPFHICMVTWRGVTDAEKGFMAYLEQKQIPTQYTFLDCKKNKAVLPHFVKEIKNMRPDLVYVFGTSGALGLCGPESNHGSDKYLTDIPVVFNIVSVPVKSGLVSSMESSGRNLTGTSHIAPLPTQIKAIQTLLPLKRFGVVYNPQEKNSIVAVEEIEQIGKDLGFTILKASFVIGPNGKPSVESIPSVITTLAKKNPQLIYLPSDSFIVGNSEKVVSAITAHGLPSFSATEGPIKKASALMGLVSRYYNVGRLAGYKAEQILIQKIRPRDIPMETLSRFSFIFNMETARSLDFYPPLSVINFAEIIN